MVQLVEIESNIVKIHQLIFPVTQAIDWHH